MDAHHARRAGILAGVHPASVRLLLFSSSTVIRARALPRKPTNTPPLPRAPYLV